MLFYNNFIKKKFLNIWSKIKKKEIENRYKRLEKEGINFIEFDNSFIFIFTDEDLKIDHPFSNYYLTIDNLAINISFSLKWLKFGFFFLDSMSKELKNIHTGYGYADYSFKHLIRNSLSSDSKLETFEKDHVIIFDGVEYKSLDDIISFVNLYAGVFHENTKVTLSLKVNLLEFLIINNCLYPSLLSPLNKELIEWELKN